MNDERRSICRLGRAGMVNQRSDLQAVRMLRMFGKCVRVCES